MNNQERLTKLISSLNFEINAATAGSSQGQFPILDLLGNLRDGSKDDPALAGLTKLTGDAWETVVGIVESGQPFKADNLLWLKDLFANIQVLVLPAASSATGTTAPAPEPSTPPAAVVAPPAPVAPAPAELEAQVLAEDPPLNLNIADDADLLREFITESREHLDNIEHGVLVLENQPLDNEMLNTVFRAFHTFKGGAGFLNLIPINRLAHVLESLLDLARQGKLKIDPSVIELILRGRDVLKQFLDQIEGQLNGSKPLTPIMIPTALLKAEVQEVIDTITAAFVLPGAAAAKSVPMDTVVTPMEPMLPLTETPAVPVATTPVAAPAEIVVLPVPVAEAAPSAPAAAASSGQTASSQSAMVKVDTSKLDGLLDLVGELVIAQSLVGQDLGTLAGMSPQFARNMAQLARITKELQRVSMSMRMVPIRGVFQKMARVSRDISTKQRKKVNFVTSGEDTELDRGVVEELNDPLLHMIRNSMDHGIEAPDKRAASGKAPVGTLELRAFHQGGNIIVEIQDDGAGLNREKILKKAIERGLTTAEKQHTDEEVYAFIFGAGFSTAEKITELSGRGVGLDVVRRNIERLRGRVDISSEFGKGTTFRISLPLTLAIIDGLIVRVGEERYIIPTLSVRESFRLVPGMVTHLQNRAEVVNVRGRIIPLLRLHDLFSIKSSLKDPSEGIAVVVQSGTNVRCLLVDGLLHKQEVVIKNLNDMMVHKNRSLAGAAILGDGQVGLILDVNALVVLGGGAPVLSKAA
jgi:two-component system chemotaxis sensor kinase CheA